MTKINRQLNENNRVIVVIVAENIIQKISNNCLSIRKRQYKNEKNMEKNYENKYS